MIRLTYRIEYRYFLLRAPGRCFHMVLLVWNCSFVRLTDVTDRQRDERGVHLMVHLIINGVTEIDVRLHEI